jgi:hypothetical protein
VTHREVHVEHLIGRRVRDRDGEVIGRIEEFRIGEADGETVVLEFHTGPEALLERLGGAALKLPFFSLIPYARREFQIDWQLMDLSDEKQPRLTCSLRDLERSHSSRQPE